MPNTGTYQWTTDIGQPSTAQIEALARSSKVPFTVTSSYRNEPTSWHGYHNAVDMASTTVNMINLAAYLYQYSTYLLELIHSGGDGYFVKNGQRVTAAFYGSDVADHFDHVHCAATVSALLAASRGKDVIPAGAGGQADADKTLRSKLGCLPATAVVGLTLIGGTLWTVTQHLT